MARDRFTPRPQTAEAGVPFNTVEEAWFWFVQAYDARAAGARVVAGLGTVSRPCEPLDVLRALDRLHRQRRLERDHLCVLIHYGRRMDAPDPRRDREARASSLWTEALGRLGPALRDKGIVR
ncbi:conserved hypothetical protein [uncultured Gammaproteobacteria bacterium]